MPQSTFIDQSLSEPNPLNLIVYNQHEFFDERELNNIKECNYYREKDNFYWINVEGTENAKLVKQIGLYFNMHKLLVEDVMSSEQRPKVEFYENNLFMLLKMLSYDSEAKKLHDEQMSIVLGHNYVVCFQEGKEGDVLEPIREKLRGKASVKMRHAGSGYLFYLILKEILNNYSIILEKIADELEVLEDRIIEQDATDNPTKDLYNYRRILKTLYKFVRPLREMSSRLVREDEKDSMVGNVRYYMQDVHDQVLYIVENTESFIDVTANLLDLYLSILSNKTNDVMRVLTVFSSIFLPLSFIAGVYGMNFEYMPETKFQYGYFLTITLMLGVSFAIIWYYRKKKWL